MTHTIAVSVAFGADRTAVWTSWTWTNITSRVLGTAQITQGSGGYTTDLQPAQLTGLRLKNTDGWFTPRNPASPYYSTWGRGTPIWFTLDSGSGPVTRFFGYIDSVRPSWPSGNSDYAEVEIVASGRLRSLQRGQVLASPMQRAIVAAGPVAYWSLEDESGVTQAGTPVVGGYPMDTTSVSFGSVNTLPGASSLPTFADSGSLAGRVGHTFAANWQVDWYMFLPAYPAALTTVMQVASATGTVRTWSYAIGPASQTLSRTDAAGTVTTTTVALPGIYTGQWMHYRLMVQEVAGTLTWMLVFFPLAGAGSFFTNTMAGTLGDIYNVVVPPQASSLTGISYGHIAVWDDYNFSATDNAARGYAPDPVLGGFGEVATDRLSRLCSEENVVYAATGTATQAMGAQGSTALLDLMRDCVASDQGVLTDGLTAGVTYLAGPSRYNRSVTMALDAKRQQVKVPLEPSDDDQATKNDWTVSRRGGSKGVRAVESDPAEPNSTAKIGTYSDSATLNVERDGQLADHAGWRLHLGTTAELRAPTISVDVLHSPELIPSWVAMRPGYRFTVANLPSQYPSTGLDLILDGYTETIDAVTWRVDLTGSPFGPWRVWKLEDSSQGRLDTAGSQLDAAYTAGATTMSVATTSGPIWITTATRPTKFPFGIDVNGYQMTVTGITGTASPQTFTVTPLPVGFASGSKVKLWRQSALAL